MKHFADQISSWLVRQGLPEAQKEIYSYGLECLTSELLTDILLFLAALFLHKIPEMLVWSFAFMLLRVNLGGLHASSHSRCIFYSTAIGIISVQIYPYFIGSLPVMIVISILVCLLTFLIAPVIHPNHPVSAQREQSAHRLSVCISLSETCLLIILYFFFPKMSSSIFLGLTSAGLLGGLGYMKSRRLSGDLKE